MDRKERYYKINLGLDLSDTSEDEEIYIQIKEDKTISIIKEGTKNHPRIVLRPLLKELTNREYVESLNKMENQYHTSIQDLESRVDNMKE
jgi:hypothetical protein